MSTLDLSTTALNLTTGGNSSPTARQTRSEQASAAKRTSPGTQQTLSAEQQRMVDRLKQVDRQVRDHEAAHLHAGAGVVTSGANFSYTYGPDGKQYAVAGEVGIDTSRETRPRDNIDKGRRIQAAALAPADPSSQDYRVAAIGGQLVTEGQRALVTEQTAPATKPEPAAVAANASTAAQPDTRTGSFIAGFYGSIDPAGAAGRQLNIYA